MGRKVVLAYTLFSILALVSLAVWTTYSVLETRTENLLLAGRNFEKLTERIASACNASEGFASVSFRSDVRSLFLADPTLQVIVIRSRAGGVRYLFARHASFVENRDRVESSWHGSILYNTVSEARFSSPLALSSEPHTHLSAVYTIFDRRSLSFTLRTVLTVLLSFLVLTAIVIALRSIMLSRRRAPSLPSSGGARPVPPPAPQPAAEPFPFEEKAQPSAAKGSHSATGEAPSRVDGRAGTETPTAGPSATPSTEAAPTEAAGRAPGSALDLETEVEETPVLAAPDAAPEPEAKWAQLSEEIVPLEPEEPPPAPAPLEPPLRGPSPASLLPPEEPLPAPAPLEPQPEPASSRHDQLASRHDEPGAAAAAIAQPSPPATEPDDQAEGPGATDHQPNAEDELADIDDFEDLETIDGSSPASDDEPPPLRRPVPARPAPHPVAAPVSGEEFGELEELTEEPFPRPAPPPPTAPRGRGADAGPATVAASEAPLREASGAASIGTGLLRRLLAQEAAEGGGPNRERRTGSGDRHPSGSPSSGAIGAKPPTTGSPRGLFSPETGLGWPDYFEKRLSFEIDRCASFDQDLSLALMRCRASLSAEARREIAGRILSGLSFQDLSFEYADDGFAVILPNLDLDDALEKLEQFHSRLAEQERFASLRIGVAARDGRLLSGAQLIAEADQALARAAAGHAQPVVPMRVEVSRPRGDFGS